MKKNKQKNKRSFLFQEGTWAMKTEGSIILVPQDIFFVSNHSEHAVSAAALKNDQAGTRVLKLMIHNSTGISIMDNCILSLKIFACEINRKKKNQKTNKQKRQIII